MSDDTLDATRVAFDPCLIGDNLYQRQQFLFAPSPEIVEAWEEPDLPPVRYLRGYEAQCSTWIEGEEKHASLINALRRRRKDITCDMLLDAHKILMKGKPYYLSPGNLRRLNVRVGRYRPPDWNDVPYFMKQLDEFLQDESIPPVLKAVWGHIQFETIHPFADGNGRIGRLLVNKILGRPFAPGVLAHRATYYSLLDGGNWEEWRIWMVAILRTCPDTPVMTSNPWL